MNDWTLETFRNEVEDYLKHVVKNAISTDFLGLGNLIEYQMGWVGDSRGITVKGKRLRPLLVLLASEAATGTWKQALPAAAAVEFLHNFSLVHDDIEDGSEIRRGRPTLWKKWGNGLAINAGDALYGLAFRSLLEDNNSNTMEISHLWSSILVRSAINLTGGQHLDISYESKKSITLNEYWKMVSGKTAALLSACTEMGAITADISEQKVMSFREFGLALGMAYQAKDDWIGIWGDTSKSGKSNESDLTSGKKTLPILYGLQCGLQFAERWKHGPILKSEVNELAQYLVNEGAENYVRGKVTQWCEIALSNLDKIDNQDRATQELSRIVQGLMAFP